MEIDELLLLVDVDVEMGVGRAAGVGLEEVVAGVGLREEGERDRTALEEEE